MERIDKIIASQGIYSRSEVKKIISQGRVSVNDKTIKKSDLKIDTEKDEIFIDGKKLDIKKEIYLILNKPKGYISATEDSKQKVVLDLVPDSLRRKDLFPVGRLDIDTTGLLIITNDGVFSHNILSPKKHIDKTYEATIDIPVNDEIIHGFERGVELNDGICKPAVLKKKDEFIAIVTISEGKYHQIKRMFGCFGAKVLELKRISIGKFELPDDLEEGQCRELTEDELELIKK